MKFYKKKKREMSEQEKAKEFDVNLLDLLCCPGCKGKLELSSQALQCEKCKIDYPIDRGVPILVRPEKRRLCYEEAYKLEEEQRKWNRKKFLRLVYYSWYERILSRLDNSRVILELSGGSGNFKRYFKKIISSDIRFHPELDFVTDAEELSVKNGVLDSVIVIDGIHHYPQLFQFIEEIVRVLKDGGKLVAIEPYLSPVSGAIRRLFHHEDIDWQSLDVGGNSTDGNLAVPTVLFERNPEILTNRFSELKITYKETFDSLSYPLSGGKLSNRSLPGWSFKLISGLENILPFKSKFNFKMMIELVKVSRDST